MVIIGAPKMWTLPFVPQSFLTNCDTGGLKELRKDTKRIQELRESNVKKDEKIEQLSRSKVVSDDMYIYRKNIKNPSWSKLSRKHPRSAEEYDTFLRYSMVYPEIFRYELLDSPFGRRLWSAENSKYRDQFGVHRRLMEQRELEKQRQFYDYERDMKGRTSYGLLPVPNSSSSY